jgi:UDP-N-acetyl-alpha-D-muramoyl-L-alanyl-L-glutamate epimerase
MALRPEDIESFRITELDVDLQAATVRLRYALDDAVAFEERIDFAPGRRSAAGHAGGGRARRPSLTPAQEQGLLACLRLLHVAAGVSYYKTAAPPRISVEAHAMSDAEASFAHHLYDFGLREFSYRNGLEIPHPVEIGFGRAASAPTATAPPAPGLGIPVGGGKDSIVVVDALAPRRPRLLSVNGHPAARRVAAVAGLDLVVVRRALAPELFELNRAGALNGHVPITAIVSLIAVAAGFFHGWDTTVMALEASADDPTRAVGGKAGGSGGVEVNHQWSKSRAFEHELADVLRQTVHPAVRYLSALRDVTDLEIAAVFATRPDYHPVFRSCNRVFGLSSTFDGWCRDCPKCRFVYLTLATAMDRLALVRIFGADMLSDLSQSDGFRDLLEEGRKPFECVGTRAEALAAFRRLLADPRWSSSPVLVAVRPVIDGLEVGATDASPASPHAAPSAVVSAVDALRPAPAPR